MRNYYPVQSPVQDDVPYSVHVFLRGGTGFCEHFPTYSAAMEYYGSPATRGEKVTHVALRPTPAWLLEQLAEQD